MPGTQLPQTKRAIAALKTAGLRRNEFRVRTPCKKGGYERTQVRVWDHKRALELKDELVAQGFHVVVWYDIENDEPFWVQVRISYTGGRLEHIHRRELHRWLDKLKEERDELQS